MGRDATAGTSYRFKNMSSSSSPELQPAASAVQSPHSEGQSETTRTRAASHAFASFWVRCWLTHINRSAQGAWLPPWSHVLAHASSGETVVVRLSVVVVPVLVEDV